jgi:DNA polymerase III epsilon subunit-like protein
MNIIVIDFETTGLPKPKTAPLSAQPRIIEIGAALIDQECNIIEQCSTLVYPEQEISSEITRITGLTNDDLSTAVTFQYACTDFRRMWNSAGAVFAHNLAFDYGMLRIELEHLSTHDLELWSFPMRDFCTVELFRHIWGRRMKLTELYEHWIHKPLKQTHRALDDVGALTEVLRASEVIKSCFD